MTGLFILLDAATADAVRGPGATDAVLAPVPLADGLTWALPVAVLADPAHAAHHARLAGCPQRAVAAQDWPTAAGPASPDQ
ncbi:hypothetical protein [Aquabacter spiritensis]|uniref:Uncharacterized protein n=1 Tax=Aquabacter spiritensis TaxID=933073 RepID=A0A4R3M320_9HYPH|nr:hypothetical protein [Aquabacter spiritensis]TCT07611.1 hypothetical protein EDC64_101130 [Aquabacter spiritensis]